MPHDESSSERLTRKRRIDPLLDKAGWRNRGRGGDAYRVEEFETSAGPADYALCLGDEAFGVVEAKKLSLGPQNVLTQAQRYSRGATSNTLRFGEYRVPFLYSTNGEVIWFHDVRHELNRSRRVAGFHTPGAFREMMQLDFDAACDQLRATPNSHPRLRPYQVEANAAVEAAIAARKREMLVAMATGTGKTFTMVNQVYRLMKAGVARRVLFLVDRRALAAQAVRAFKSFEPEPALKFDQIYELYSQQFKREDFDEDEQFDPTVLPSNYLLDPNPGLAFVYVCTIQRLAMNLFGRKAAEKAFGELEGGDDDAETLDIPIHAFDLIIADECHRGYTGQELSVWRDTLNHFDAIRLGLTATPAAHTTAYFGAPVFRYEYDRAVREGHLVDYDVVKVHSDVRLKGIFLQEGEQVGLVDTTSGAEQLDRLEDERTFEPQEVERKVTSPDSNRKIIEKLREHCAQHEQRYGRFPTYYRTRHEAVLPRYLSYFMQGQFWQDQLRSVMEQTTRNQVSVTKQVEFQVILPPIEEQAEIVRRVESLFAFADKIESRVHAAAARVEKITQAILAKAFRGELVPTEAELARQEDRDYEPASELLARTISQKKLAGRPGRATKPVAKLDESSTKARRSKSTAARR